MTNLLIEQRLGVYLHNDSGMAYGPKNSRTYEQHNTLHSSFLGECVVKTHHHIHRFSNVFPEAAKWPRKVPKMPTRFAAWHTKNCAGLYS